MSKLSESHKMELKSLLEDFNERMNQEIAKSKEAMAQSFADGEYNNMVPQFYSVDEKFLPLSSKLAEAFDKSSISIKDLVAWAVDQGHFIMVFEELSDPSKFSGNHENEFFILPWGGMRDVSIESSVFSDFQPSFNLKSSFDSLESFLEAGRELVSNHEFLNNFYSILANGSDKETLKVDFNSDIVRVQLANEDKLIAKLGTRSKRLAEFEKILKAHDWDYHYAEGNAWSKGEKSANLIQNMIKELGPEAQAMYDEMKR